jgi:predicted dehydrogenase
MKKVRLAFIGCGLMALEHLDMILQQQDTTEVVVGCDPSDEAYQLFAQRFTRAGLVPPPNEKDLSRLLHFFGPNLDAAFIITPHALHNAQTVACLDAGLDVLLEKPMVINAVEAEGLIKTRDRTGRLLVVAFPGSLSPQIRTAKHWLANGELGELLNISGMTWQNWKQEKAGTWRQDPVQAGGGFLFDTGAHLLNTTVDLAGEDFVEVAAWIDRRGTEVDILAAVLGRLKSGAMVSLTACGDTVESCRSEMYLYCTKGIIHTGMWGERLLLQRPGEKDLLPVQVPESLGVWQQFLQVRDGKIPNPCPPEVGLRMAYLWDAIVLSASTGGKMIQVKRNEG